MTHLEQKIYDALMRYEDASERDIMTGSVCRGHAQVAAKIALDLAYKAFEVGNGVWNDISDDELKEAFDDFINDRRKLW